MKRRVVGKVRRGQNVPQIFKGNAADPGIFHDVLRIIDGKKAEAKIADVQDERRHDQQQERDRIGLPHSRNDGHRGDASLAFPRLGFDFCRRNSFVSAEFFLFDVLILSHWDRHTRYDSVFEEKCAVCLNVLVH